MESYFEIEVYEGMPAVDIAYAISDAVKFATKVVKQGCTPDITIVCNNTEYGPNKYTIRIEYKVA